MDYLCFNVLMCLSSRGMPRLTYTLIGVGLGFHLSGLKERARSQAMLVALTMPDMVDNFSDFGAVLC